MREFMTRVSDYFNERRNDPERKEDRLSIAVIGAVAAVIVVLLLLLLWGYTTQEKKKQEAAEKAQDLLEEQGITAASYEEKMEEYMSRNAGEELRQEYLTGTNDLGEKVWELQTALEQLQKELENVVVGYQEGQKEELILLKKEINTALERIREIETEYADLSDLIQVIDQEKITMIQAQIQTLQEKLESLSSALEKDMNEINRRIDALSAAVLTYRYDQESNTLYLMPGQ